MVDTLGEPIEKLLGNLRVEQIKDNINRLKKKLSASHKDNVIYNNFYPSVI